MLQQVGFTTREDRDRFYHIKRETHRDVCRGTEQEEGKILWYVAFGDPKPALALSNGTILETEGEESYGVEETQETETMPAQETLPDASSC